MTEAVTHGQPIGALGAQIRPSWRTSTNNALEEQPVLSARRHASLPSAVPSVYVTSIRMVDPPFQRPPKEQNYGELAAKTSTKSTDAKEANDIKADDSLSDDAAVAGPSNSAADVSVHAQPPRKGSAGEIKWQNFQDEEDEETSEDYDDEVEDTEEEGDDNKPGVSDTETKNLLDEVEEDVESDNEDTPDHPNVAGAVKFHEGSSDGSALRRSKLVGKHEDRELITLSDESLYEMSEQQKEYYTRCFIYLMKTTLGHFDLNGAVHGANEHVVEFFKKSDLDTDTLSKIWALSDVNEDGYLDHAEFSTAMHLIVLNVKGNIAIPDYLPDCIRPPMTSPRNTLNNVTNSTVLHVDTESCAGPGRTVVKDERQQSTKTPLGWKQFDYDESSAHTVQQQHSLSDDHLHAHINRTEVVERLRDFSDVPPLLVDSRPTALKATQPMACSVDSNSVSYIGSQVGAELLKNTLSPQVPKGPPPKPPPRPPNRGHGRSASLDLNPLASLSAAGFTAYSLSSKIAQGEAGIASTTSHTYAIPVPLADPSSVPECANPQPNLPAAVPSARSPVAGPPLPFRPVLVDAEVQTDDLPKDCTRDETPKSSSVQEPELIEFSDDLEKHIKELIEKETLSMAGEGGAQVNWKERCAQLKKVNAELELEKAKLAQIRLQLEVRLQEVSPATPSAVKPTSL